MKLAFHGFTYFSRTIVFLKNYYDIFTFTHRHSYDFLAVGYIIHRPYTCQEFLYLFLSRAGKDANETKRRIAFLHLEFLPLQL